MTDKVLTNIVYAINTREKIIKKKLEEKKKSEEEEEECTCVCQKPNDWNKFKRIK